MKNKRKRTRVIEYENLYIQYIFVYILDTNIYIAYQESNEG